MGTPTAARVSAPAQIFQKPIIKEVPRTHINKSVCVYVCVCVCVYIYIVIYKCIYVCMYKMYVYTYMSYRCKFLGVSYEFLGILGIPWNFL